LLVLEARTALKRGDSAAAHVASTRAVELGERFADPELRAFGLLAKGQTLARQGSTAEAVAHFDEAMVAITIGGLSPIGVGTVYCAVIEVCHQIMDLGRMREWTEVLSGWCREQPDLVPFRGQCLVHRAEILCISGAWSMALDEARQACGPASGAAPPEEAAGESPAIDPPSVARTWPVGAALYQIAEIQRVRGQFAEAEAAYREANAYGRPPGAGLALLRLAQGDTAGAAAAIRRALAEPVDVRVRAAALAAAVEIEISARDTAAARRAVDLLAALGAEARLPWLAALLAQSSGSLLLAEGDARGAIERLREAWMVWQEIEAPYEAARARVAMGLAHRALGDEEAAVLEFDAARRVCERLGAEPELRRIEGLRRASKRAAIAGLTPREQEILARVATGMTNRAIAQELFISERTVDRHVSNILTKLDLTSRSAATAYAYEHGLV
jgi:DNA-binding CsgD family transcriptional regulator